MHNNVVLALSWSDYEARKIAENSDVHIFCPERPWELNYLIRKLRQQFGQYTETAIFLTIRNTARLLPAPRQRAVFVDYVIQNLLQRQPCQLN